LALSLITVPVHIFGVMIIMIKNIRFIRRILWKLHNH
jgi:hypothetical protein